ncbi:NfeD family protein [Euzebya rosea]|uniref:NfeD family protein n=1 Tax=Euzebya rosea TaxID=2052804 RepID=UPI000D3E0302|nr:NfeD family protein [Euzebya rosea]
MALHRIAGGVLLLVGLLAALAAPASAQAQPSSTVDVVEAVGVLDGPLTDFVIGTIEQANLDAAQAVVVRLDTDGALGGDIDRLVDTIESSDVPVVVYVGTAGARATGAGVRVAAAAHVLALAPTSIYGAAHPADLGDPGALTVGEVAADLEVLADARGRDAGFLVDAAESGAAVIAVPDGETGAPIADGTELPEGTDPAVVRTLDESALVETGIADIVAPTIQQVLAALGGLEVTTAAGDVVLDVDPVTANVRFVNLDLVQRILHTASSPTLAYLLLLAGALTLFFEVFQPGFGVSGFSAIGVLALGVYSVAVLPIHPLWAVVAVVGLLLLAYDLAIAGLSWPSAVGTLALGAGSIRMWAIPQLAPPTWLIVVGTISAAVFFIMMMTSVLRAQGNQALLGAKAVEGKVGIVRSALGPEGHIFVGGALWRARAPQGAGKVRTGTKVRVLGLNDSLTLDVEIVDDSSTAGTTTTKV